MATLFGKQYSRSELLRRVGSLGQVAGIREYTYTSGRADGVKAVEVNTGRLRFEILPSRCLDISFASHDGIPVGYASKSGVRHPAYFNKSDPTGGLDNFLGGVLTTCGLHNIGPASVVDGRRHELHGKVMNIPAERVSVEEAWDDAGECTFTVRGEMRHSSFYGEDLVLRRTITASLGAASVRIDDEVENLDFAPSPCVLLYHMQFGFPILDERSVLLTSPIRSSRLRIGGEKAEPAQFGNFSAPRDGEEETCFYHEFAPDAEGCAAACIFNPDLGEKGVGAYVRYHVATLPVFVQWKMMRSREYVCGLEPATSRLDNRSPEEMAACTLAPLEKRRYSVEFGVLEGEAACREAMRGAAQADGGCEK